ncbi:MAG: sce7725 family protein [Bacteroidia bacterium]
MYYPYLRARQFELISLRELVSENLIQNFVTPVFEPVKESFSNLNLAHKVFLENDFNAYLIVNPIHGEMPGDSITFLDYINQLGDSKFLSAFHYNNNLEYISQSLLKYGLSNCMIICLDNFSDNRDFRELCNNPAITHIMLLDPNKYRSLDRFLKGLNKNYIRLDDVFERQQKNADFLDIPAHKFTEEHLYYSEENYSGFSDYTVLTSEYIDGGSTPRAVVIHLTYINEAEEEQVWIRHFTSTTNDTIANVQGKFAQAAQKAILFCEQNNFTNSAIIELANYLNEGKYPGLGTVKKISIKNHLTIISNFLNTRNA